MTYLEIQKLLDTRVKIVPKAFAAQYILCDFDMMLNYKKDYNKYCIVANNQQEI